jgi:four helix bundle protein
MSQNIVLTKSFDFAVRVVNLYKYLSKDQKEYILSKQLLRSGTSIGANINEAQAGQSKKDFIAKMAIASKEAREAKYWIDLLIKTDYLNSKDNHTKSLLTVFVKVVVRFIHAAFNKTSSSARISFGGFSHTKKQLT